MTTANTGQENTDGDNLGDACEVCGNEIYDGGDADNDGIPNGCDPTCFNGVGVSVANDTVTCI